MSNVQSYNALIDRFKAFASGHFILKTFSHGQIDTADLEKFTEYPFMHVVPSNVTYAKGTKTFSFQIVLADLPRDKDDKVEFQREVLSDLQRIAEDLVAEITNHRVLFGDLITVQNVSLEPFLEEFHNTLTGWTVSLDLLVPYYWDACSIPAEWNDFFESGSGGTGSILTFIDSITRDNNGNVSLVNDEATPSPNYYYGTNNEGVRGWYLLSDEVGLTCETIGDCQTIIDIEAAIDALEEEIVLKADITSISAVGFSNDYDDLDNKPTIPAAQVNSDWNATSGVAEILNKPTIPTGTVTSVGLTMPSAFSVANSPITSSGDIAVTGAGVVSQYVRGDGSLANFPSSTGGGASLSFYLNGSVAQGTFGGVAFKEMDRTPVFGAGTDFTINANGYIQSFITDANVPNLLEIPAGNWNFETYFSASSNGGSPSFYVELYKWNGATLSLIASNSATPEGITNGTAIDLYVSALAIPQTTLAATDRLAIRIYVTHSGRTIKLHTENSHLCQVITTFSTGLTALNGLTAQVQNFATGTSGTDFGISSATSTHTFNLPTASAANRGALSSADWSAFNGKFTLPSLTSGSVLFSNGTTIAQDNANLFWDDTNNRLGIGTASPAYRLDVVGLYDSLPARILRQATYGEILRIGRNGVSETASINYPADGVFAINTVSSERMRINSAGNVLIGTTTDAGYKLDVNGSVRTTGSISAASAVARGTYLNQTLVATANNDVLVGLDIQPTFTTGAFTGVQSIALRLPNGGRITNASTVSGYNVYIASTETTLNSPVSTGTVGFQLNYGFVGRFMGTTGNFILQNGGTFTDAGYRLDVNGTMRVQNNFFIGSGSAIASLGNAVNLRSNLVGGSGYVVNAQSYNTLNSANNEQGFGEFTGTYAPTSVSGTPSFNALKLTPTINQTGGANGITRGLFINPTLTAAADFRAIEVGSGITILGAATTAKASLRIPSGTAPTSPVNGDIWFDGTDIKMRIGGVTKTFTLI